jgi:hypothetical protein
MRSRLVLLEFEFNEYATSPDSSFLQTNHMNMNASVEINKFSHMNATTPLLVQIMIMLIMPYTIILLLK